MKLFLFIFAIMFSSSALAAQESSYHYSNLPPFGNTGFAVFHRNECVPTILSLESGHSFVAAWVAEINTRYVSITILNVGGATQSGTARIRLGACQ